jgi:hypothetical protein
VSNYIHFSSIVDRTEVEVVTHCDELQVDKADRTEVDVDAYHDELQVDQADRTGNAKLLKLDLDVFYYAA